MSKVHAWDIISLNEAHVHQTVYTSAHAMIKQNNQHTRQIWIKRSIYNTILYRKYIHFVGIHFVNINKEKHVGKFIETETEKDASTCDTWADIRSHCFKYSYILTTLYSQEIQNGQTTYMHENGVARYGFQFASDRSEIWQTCSLNVRAIIGDPFRTQTCGFDETSPDLVVRCFNA